MYKSVSVNDFMNMFIFRIEEKGKKYHRVERSYGSFERSFSVPADAEDEKVSAQFKEGVLLVHLPKGETGKTKRLQIKVT